MSMENYRLSIDSISRLYKWFLRNYYLEVFRNYSISPDVVAAHTNHQDLVVTNLESMKTSITLFAKGHHCPHFLLIGTRPTIRYIGVKIPNSPPFANPIPPLWSKTWVLDVPAGANRRNSIILSEYVVRRSPSQLNWKRWVNGFHEGMSGSILNWKIKSDNRIIMSNQWAKTQYFIVLWYLPRFASTVVFLCFLWQTIFPRHGILPSTILIKNQISFFQDFKSSLLQRLQTVMSCGNVR